MKVVMIDQDGVLLGRNYQATIKIADFFRNLPADVMIVPNSDTPVARIRYNFEQIAGIRPEVVIGEKGAVVALGDRDHFISAIKGLEEYRQQLISRFGDRGCEIVIGDSATWIRERKKFTPNKRMLIVDSYRQQTVGFYIVATDNEGVARLDNEWYEEGSAIVRQLALPQGIEAKDFNAKYGIVIMNAAGITKTDGYRLLLQHYPNDQFFMIGDSVIDIIEDAKVIHCAVGNACAEFKQKAAYVAPSQITAGLKECLQWIIAA